MFEKGKINKNHPLYAEYIEKCEEITRLIEEESDAMDEKYKDKIGKVKDGEFEIGNIARKYFPQIKSLKKEYSFLWDNNE